MRGERSCRLSVRADVTFSDHSAGTKLMASERKRSSSRSRSVSGKRVAATTTAPKRRTRVATGVSAASGYAICVKNDDYPASLELRKLYAVLEDAFADQHSMIRVVDESGEDYLYPQTYFVRVELPRAVERVLHKIA